MSASIWLRRCGAVAVVGVLAALTSGCDFDGVQAMPLPGGVGTGGDAITLTVDLPDVGTLVPNAEVKVADIPVGTVTSLRVEDWHAVAELSIKGDVELPADAVARVGVNSLLGASFIELAAPQGGGTGQLASGARIPLDRSAAYPATEQVLASASVVLNGGGLEQLATITSELNRAFSGNQLAVSDLIPRLDSFVSALDGQRGEIISAIRSVDRLSRSYAGNTGTINRALDELGPALRALSEERPQLVRALGALRQLGEVATPLVRDAKADLVANLRDLVPVLTAVTRAGDSVARGLGYAVTFPFPTDTVDESCRSDYCNLFATIDITAEALAEGFIGPNGKPTIPGLPGLPSDLLELLPPLPSLPGLTARPGAATGLSGAEPAASSEAESATQPELLSNLLPTLGSLFGGS